MRVCRGREGLTCLNRKCLYDTRTCGCRAVCLCVCVCVKKRKTTKRKEGSDEMDPCRARMGIEQVVVAAEYHPRFGLDPRLKEGCGS